MNNNVKMNICYSDTQKIIHEISSNALGFVYPHENIFQHIFVDKFIFKPVAVSYSSHTFNGSHIFLKGIMAIFFNGDIIGVFKKTKQEYQTDTEYDNYGGTSYKDGTYDHSINKIVLSYNFKKHKEEIRTILMNEIYGVKGNKHHKENTYISDKIDLEFLENMVYNFEYSDNDKIPTSEQLSELIKYYKQGVKIDETNL